ncbi:hypothetical protein PLICBS_004159 [Purpureocillium lilacinum]|uniref:uncharacterized protein n=1 Tax=Purpureocillium lilacinum TaxID=33203 RepID=UPI00208AEB2E|nr:hypothetical protein PLICBS_004159 [Purpureocillium lilacinum]
MSARMLDRFSYCPKTLFRLNNGTRIKLRDLAAKARSSYDVKSENGLVLPKALNPLTYSGEKTSQFLGPVQDIYELGPNGASMRPLGEAQSSLVRSFKGDDMLVWAVPEGTVLPETLTLVLEHDDHYSLQPAEKMSVKDLNQELTRFFTTHATKYTREQWCRIFEEGWIPHPDSNDYYRYRDDGSVEWHSQVQAIEEGWTLHPDNGDYYRYRENGSLEWYSQVQASSSSAHQHGKGKEKGKGKSSR